MHALDIAYGTGDPAFALAEAVGPDGHVAATDLAPKMSAIAEAGSQAAGISNMSFQESDAEALPFPDETFDAVTRRLGVMFFTDAVKGLSEFRRVLKPGAIAALVAWAGQQDLRALSTVGVLTRYLPAESQSDANPGRTRVESFSKDGTFAEALRAAGFQSVWQETRTVPIPWPGSVEDCWKFVSRRGGRNVLDRIPTARQAEALAEVMATLQTYYDAQHVNLEASIVVGAGTR